MIVDRPAISVFISVPIAAFRVAYAREYLETYPVPPPSTVYGMLLSLVGESDRERHAGAELAVAMLSQPARSRVLRTAWRFKDQRTPPGLDENKRPDWQELLSDVRLAVFGRPGTHEVATPSLTHRVQAVMADWSSSDRFGGLSLGESSHLVDEVRPLRAGDMTRVRALVLDPNGSLSLPIWPDHVGSSKTRWGSFSLLPVHDTMPAHAWVDVAPADGGG